MKQFLLFAATVVAICALVVVGLKFARSYADLKVQGDALKAEQAADAWRKAIVAAPVAAPAPVAKPVPIPAPKPAPAKVVPIAKAAPAPKPVEPQHWYAPSCGRSLNSRRPCPKQ